MVKILLLLKITILSLQCQFLPDSDHFREENYACNHHEIAEIITIKNKPSYEDHCWRCKSYISSEKNKRCKLCGWYICNNCGACEYDCKNCPSWSANKSSASSSNNDWVWILLTIAIVGGIIGFSYYSDHRR